MKNAGFFLCVQLVFEAAVLHHDHLQSMLTCLTGFLHSWMLGVEVASFRLT